MSDTQLAVQGEQAVAPRQDMYSAVLAAVHDPEMDPERLEKFLAVAERMETRKAQQLFNQAFHAAKSEMDGLHIDRRGRITYKGGASIPYAKYEDIAGAIKPILSKYGLAESFSFRSIESPPKSICVMRLTHVAGHSEEFQSIPLPLVDDSGGKNAVQGAGSVASYGKRYAIVLAFDILVEGEDDDGSGLGDQPPITDEQAAQIRDCIAEIEGREKGAAERFRAWLQKSQGTDDIDALHQGRQFQMVMDALKVKLNAPKKGSGK